MTLDVNLANSLRYAAEGDSALATVLRHFGTRTKKQTIEVDKIESSTSLDRFQVVRALKTLDRLGFGRFIAGRKGHQSRFTPEYAPDVIASCIDPKVADDQEARPLDLPAPQTPTPPEDHHVFLMRREPLRRVLIPADATADELKRLAAFIGALASEV